MKDYNLHFAFAEEVWFTLFISTQLCKLYRIIGLQLVSVWYFYNTAIHLINLALEHTHLLCPVSRQEVLFIMVLIAVEWPVYLSSWLCSWRLNSFSWCNLHLAFVEEGRCRCTFINSWLCCNYSIDQLLPGKGFVRLLSQHLFTNSLQIYLIFCLQLLQVQGAALLIAVLLLHTLKEFRLSVLFFYRVKVHCPILQYLHSLIQTC